MAYRFDTIRKSTVQFMNIFNEININKYDGDGNIRDTVQVPLKLAGKQKFYYGLYRRKVKRFPMMSASPTSIEPAINERGRNQKLNFLNPSMEKVIQTPTPYNLTFELALVTNYIDEANQVLEQILPYFHPYVITTVGLPEIDLEFDMKVVLNDVSQDRDFELPEDEYRTLSWVLNFTLHTYIFKPIVDAKLIETINLNYKKFNGDEGDNILERSVIDEESTDLITYEMLHDI